ncbi:uncharacterized protein [Parasteatoda tepidariorum]|uniref:uncharacterized protein isoform X3 n=1 Tax=Parasteatoda tepidariorum TaxID=114398 RepID=UPI001C722195|nr:uncharacterized protein LOC107436825 isoform X3 [Parasteatoda tepidariorum]
MPSTWSELALQCGGLCSMSDTMDSFKELGGVPQPSVRIKHLTRNSDGSSRFPKLDECAHFHYDHVELGPITVGLCDGDEVRIEGSKNNNSAGVQQQQPEFCVQVSSNGKSWQIRRSLDNFQMLDRQLHRCVYDRKFSLLKEIETQPEEDAAALRTMLTHYLDRFSQLAGSLINCGPVLNWLELDNRGNRLIVTDEAAINTPAIAAAYVVKRYASQATDEISLEVGDIISVIDMPPPEESSWWRGKKGFQVGFFPCECVEIIGDKLPQSIKIPKAPSKPVLRKHGKLIAFFRSFLLTRPSRRKLKQSGILKERVFGCDLGEHLMNTGRDIPLVLKCCTEFIEQHGIVDGIYRLSGVTSNIQKLRIAFDEDRVPNLVDEAILQDIHCVASLLKMYFRELPNPLLTFHLYDKFVSAVQAEEDLRLLKLRDVVQQLPPPHYRSLEYLMRHLSKVAAHGYQTGMTPKNVAIVWAPNLLRSRDIENGGVGALHVVGVQAVLTEYLIRYTDIIFSEKMPIFPSPKLIEVETPKKTRPKSLAISTPTKLLSLEEARSRALTSNLPGDQQKFIDVGGGEENLPIKYHTIIELPARRRSMGKSKKSPSGWKSLFSRGWHTTSGRRKNRHLRGEGGERPKIGSPIFSEHSPLVLKDKAVTESDVSHTKPKRLRTVKSAENLFPLLANSSHSTQEYAPSGEDIPLSQEFEFNSLSDIHSSHYQRHMRSSSHDSYFERLLSANESTVEDVPCEGSQTHTLQKVPNILDSGQPAKGSHENNKNSGVKRSKSAYKQKLVSFDTEATSPKLQKLSLKRLYHTLSSPPLIKKESSKRDHNSSANTNAQIDHSELDSHLSGPLSDKQSFSTFSENMQNSVPLNNREILLSNRESQNSCPFNNPDVVTVEVHPSVPSTSTANLPEDSPVNYETSLADDLDDHVNFSMEATLSDSASLSQLLSFDSKEQNVCNPESLEHQSGYSWAPQDSSLATPESPTGDNVSDIPSSGSSANSGSISDVSKQNLAPEAFIAEMQNRHLANNGVSDKDGIKVTPDLVDDISHPNDEKQQPVSSLEHFQIALSSGHDTFSQEYTTLSNSENTSMTSSAHTPKSNASIDNLILSPPENFNDRQRIYAFDEEDNMVSNVVAKIKTSAKYPSARTMERSKTEVHEICPKFVSGIAVSGSFAQDLYRANTDSGESFHKKRSCSDKLSPISPIEESKRKFESEIGRLIVRDRQMKLEMEQMKAERQKRGADSSIFSELDKTRLKSDRKFADALEFKKSPVKTCDNEKKRNDCDELLLKPVREERKTNSVPPFSYSRYMRMENKPSVKELLSKFESHKDEDTSGSPKVHSDNLIPLQKQSSCVFSNVQVINHNFPLTYSRSVGSNCNFDPSARDNHSKENIFQTECVIRFPHPKLLSQTYNKSDSKHTFHDFGTSNTWSSDQYNFSSSNPSENSIFSSSDHPLSSSSPRLDSSSLVNSLGKKSCAELPPLSESVVSGNLSDSLKYDKESTKCSRDWEMDNSSTDNGNKFSCFKDTFNRANRALQMKNEFLQRGIPQFEEGERTTENVYSLETNRFSRSPTECRKRQTPTRQRPKSVPPPISRLSFSTIKEHDTNFAKSNTKQTACPKNVPKTSSVGLTNGKTKSDSSQPYGLPKRVKERAAIFERSLSFSGSVERSPPSFNYSQKAQSDSSNR